MTKFRNREEVVNTQLAIAISKFGVTADAETIHVHGIHRPDVIFDLRGLRVIIEGKFSDNPAAEDVVMEDARRRVRSGLAHLAVAVIYPIELRTTPTTEILDALKTAQIKYRVVAETHESEDWFEGTPSSLMEALRRVQESLTKDDIVEKTAKSLSLKLEGIAQLWMGQPAACDRLSGILGITIPKDEKPKETEGRREEAAKVSALILANAYIFQEQLSLSDKRVTPLRKMEMKSDLVDVTAAHWRWIWQQINYIQIFQLGDRVLSELPLSGHTTAAVKALLVEAKTICSEQAALRHDLMGRIYHWLLHHAKYLGTYYTATSSATLLLKLALSSEWNRDLGDPTELASFKVADLACGTGTLLMAAAQALSDVFIRTRAGDDRSLDAVDLSTLHKTLIENTMHGYDVLPTAVHLTASTLALMAPEVAFRRMNLFVMPMGVDHGSARLGSLDFLSGSQIQTQMTLDDSQAEIIQKGAEHSNVTSVSVPKIDLCVMNPPFVRNVYGNLMFGSLPNEREEMKRALSQVARKAGVSTTAGLGAVFVPLACQKLADGGRLAFVLPVTLTTGESWASVRKLIAEKFHLETVIVSHDAERPNFSENTDLSEILIIARKLRHGEKAAGTKYINLWRNPRTIHEALDLAHRIENTKDIATIDNDSITAIRSGSAKLGEMIILPATRNAENWTGGLFAQSQLLRSYKTLNETRKLKIPGQKKDFVLPLCELGSLGELGYDVRDIFDAFAVNKTGDEWSPYAGFWDHDAKKVVSISQKSNSRLIARTKPLPGRKLKSATDVWAKSGRILLVSRLRTNTHRVLATSFSEKVLGNTWWGFNDDALSTEQRKALLLWLNSTLGLFMYFGRRAVTEGAWMQMKKPAWTSMPVLDVLSLSTVRLQFLSKAYDAISEKELSPLSKLDTDLVRRDIDDTISKVFEIPSLAPIRELLAREPGLSAKEISPRISQIDLGLPVVEEDQQISLAI